MRAKERAAVRQHGGGLSAAGSRPHVHDTTVGAARLPRYGRLVAGGRVWRKTAKASAHMLRAPKAWAVDTADLACVEALGVRYVCIHDLEQMRQYWARTETLHAKGWTLDRGFGEQTALSLDWWRPTSAEADTVAQGLPEPEPIVQPTLF